MRSEGTAVVERMREALRQRDVEAFAACFTPDYQSEQPLHPSDSFQGRDRLRQRWADAFRSLSSFDVVLLRSIGDDSECWSEWMCTGRWSNGTPFGLRGVVIFGISDGLIAWGRLYMLPDDYTSGLKLALPF